MKATEKANKKSIPNWVKIFLSIFIPIVLFLYYFTMWVYCSTNAYMIDCVEKRYDIEIQYLDTVRSHGLLPYMYKDRILKVCPKGGDREKDMFYITRKKGDFNILPNSVHDTYLTIYLRDDLEKYLSDIIDDYFDEFILYTDMTERTLSGDLNLNSSVEEYLLSLNSQPSINIRIYVPNDELSKDEVEKCYNELKDRFSSLKINAYFSLKYYRAEDYKLINMRGKPQQDCIEWYTSFTMDDE